MKAPALIVGAGGHAAVLADALLSAGVSLLGFTDQDRARHGALLCGLAVLGSDEDVLKSYQRDTVVLVNGIGTVGDPGLRTRVQQRLQADGWRFCGARHVSAVVSPFARVADDAQLLAACVIQTGAQIAEGCIINTGAVIEHDVRLGPWVHVAPRALLCGDVTVGARSHIGAGAVVRQGLKLGEQTVVGIGAAVVKSFAGGGCLVGVPARTVERNA
jgi:sugar O-acyltransferase (sialic acid O-acetyltransferase NeuD family)